MSPAGLTLPWRVLAASVLLEIVVTRYLCILALALILAAVSHQLDFLALVGFLALVHYLCFLALVLILAFVNHLLDFLAFAVLILFAVIH